MTQTVRKTGNRQGLRALCRSFGARRAVVSSLARLGVVEPPKHIFDVSRRDRSHRSLNFSHSPTASLDAGLPLVALNYSIGNING